MDGPFCMLENPIDGKKCSPPPLPLLPSEPACNPVKSPRPREVESVQVNQLAIRPITNLIIRWKEQKTDIGPVLKVFLS